MLVEVVTAGQAAGRCRPATTVRLASLLRVLAHGAADLASAGHLWPRARATPGRTISSTTCLRTRRRERSAHPERADRRRA
jgi:hypothetical protein